MTVDATLNSSFGAVSFTIASAEHTARLWLEPAGSMVLNSAQVSDLILLVGFLLTLLATFAMAIAHGAQSWRTISILMNGIAVACGLGLIAAKLQLLAMPAGEIELLRAVAGICAAAAVLLLWPSLAGIGVRSDGENPAEKEKQESLPLTARPGGPLCLEDALAGSGAVIFARTPDLRERWTVPEAAAGQPAPLLERITTALQDAFRRQTPVSDQFQTHDPETDPRWFELTVRPGRFSDGQAGAIGCLHDVTRFRRAEAECRHLLQEATHRAKNLLTIIQSVARMSAKTLGLPASAAEPFNARLQAIAMSYDLLVREDWQGAPLNDLLHSQLNHTLGNAAARASWSGPALRLRPTAVQIIALAVHELGARSLTQGAMATPVGRLNIVWEDAAMRDGSPGYRLLWQETGHAPGGPEETRNYAREILDRLTPRGLRGEVSTSQTDEGFRWEVRFPATNVLPPRQD